MGTNPINLALRFVLEIVGLVSLSIWGWRQADGIAQYALAIGIPLAAAAMWGTFAVPDDPSRSGRAPVAVPGAARLTLELVFFAIAVVALYDVGATMAAAAFGVAVIGHYVLSYDRVLWLLGRERASPTPPP